MAVVVDVEDRPAQTSMPPARWLLEAEELSGWAIVSYRNTETGALDDPPDGRAAQVWHRPDGSVAGEGHYRNGLRSDTVDGTPAWCWRDEDAAVTLVEHWRNGELDDPSDGTPAKIWYRHDGSVEREAHYHSGKLQGVVWHDAERRR